MMDGNHCYTYDAENRIVSVAPEGTGACGATTMSYMYDADGQRVARVNGSGAITEQDYYDAAGHEIAVMNGSGTLQRAEIYAGGRHLATWTNSGGGSTYFNHADWLGTERVRTFGSGSQAGQVCETITSLPFGDGLATQAVNGGCGDPSPDHFTGLERDAESGLDHTLNHQYPSSLGRWLTADPAGKGAARLDDPQTWNMYAYVRNSSTTLNDPSGLLYCSDADKTGTQNCVTDQEYKRAKNEYTGYKHYSSNLDEVKDTTVTVTHYEGQGMNRFFYGHMALSLGGGRSVGYTDRSDRYDVAATMGRRVPGAVKPIVPPQLNHPIGGVTIEVTPEQADAILQYVNETTENPGDYNLRKNNCAQFVSDALRAGEMPVPRTEYPNQLLVTIYNLSALGLVDVTSWF